MIRNKSKTFQPKNAKKKKKNEKSQDEPFEVFFMKLQTSNFIKKRLRTQTTILLKTTLV